MFVPVAHGDSSSVSRLLRPPTQMLQKQPGSAVNAKFLNMKICEIVNSVLVKVMKTFIGPRLRRLRSDAKQTQAEMAKALGISTSYVNMLEKNERSVSVPVLLRLFESYGVDWRDIADEDDGATLPHVRTVYQDPMFDAHRPDIPQ